MNILVLDQFSEPGGAQRCLLDLLPAFHERGWTTHFALPGDGPLIRTLCGQRIAVHPIRCGPYSSGRKSLADIGHFGSDVAAQVREIRALISAHGIDLAYVNGPRLLPGVALACRSRTPVVFHCHNLAGQRLARWLAGRSLRAAAATVLGSCHFVIRPLERYVPAERMHVIYNGVAGTTARGLSGRTGVWRIGVIGRIAPEKGQAEFLHAARLLGGRADCRFLVCGAPLFDARSGKRYLERLHELAAGLPVEFTGWQDDVYSVLSGLDLLVVPSMAEEATPRVILEAYAAGVPVVAFHSGGIPEIVHDGETGFLVGHRTPEALAERIRHLIQGTPEVLARVAEAARSAWRNQFTLERYRREVTELVGQCLALRRVRPPD